MYTLPSDAEDAKVFLSQTIGFPRLKALSLESVCMKLLSSLKDCLFLEQLSFSCNVTGSRLLLYQKNTWLRMMCCLQIIWWENKKFQWRSWSATILHKEDMVQAGCDYLKTSSQQLLHMKSEQCSVACHVTSDSEL